MRIIIIVFILCFITSCNDTKTSEAPETICGSMLGDYTIIVGSIQYINGSKIVYKPSVSIKGSINHFFKGYILKGNFKQHVIDPPEVVPKFNPPLKKKKQNILFGYIPVWDIIKKKNTYSIVCSKVIFFASDGDSKYFPPYSRIYDMKIYNLKKSEAARGIKQKGTSGTSGVSHSKKSRMDDGADGRRYGRRSHTGRRSILDDGATGRRSTGRRSHTLTNDISCL